MTEKQLEAIAEELVNLKERLDGVENRIREEVEAGRFFNLEKLTARRNTLRSKLVTAEKIVGILGYAFDYSLIKEDTIWSSDALVKMEG